MLLYFEQGGQALRGQHAGVQAGGANVGPPGPVPPVAPDPQAARHRDLRAVPDLHREAEDLLRRPQGVVRQCLLRLPLQAQAPLRRLHPPILHGLPGPGRPGARGRGQF